MRGSERLVLLALADQASKEKGVCWPSVAKIARRAGLSKRQTRRVLSRLRNAGEIRIVRPGGGCRRDGKGRTNYIVLPAGRSDAELAGVLAGPCHARQGSSDGDPDISDREPGQARPATLTPTTAYTVAGDRGTISEPAAEPPEEPSEEQRPTSLQSAAEKREDSCADGRNDGVDDDLDAILNDPKYQANPHWAIQNLAKLAGADEAFAHELSAGVTDSGGPLDPRVLVEYIREVEARGVRIRNPGGHLRKYLQNKGVLTS